MSTDKRYTGAVSSVIAGVRELFHSGATIGVLGDDDRVDGRTCLVTGASSGLGLAVACDLLRRGARVVVTSRSAGPELEQQILERAFGDSSGRRRGPAPSRKTDDAGRVIAQKVDLLSLDSVEALVDRLAAADLVFDVCVFNAGAVVSRFRTSSDGYEHMLQTNYLAKFLLVRKLLDRGCIKVGARPAERVPRLVFVSSEAHRSSPDVIPERFHNIEPFSIGSSMRYYGYSKMLLTIFTEELSRRINGGGAVRASVFAMCPGPVNSRIAREAPALVQPLLKAVFAVLFRSPDRAAEPVIYLACAPAIEGQDRIYLHLMNRKAKDSRALDADLGRRLWEQSELLLSNRF